LLFDNEKARFLELFIIGDWLILLLYLINAYGLFSPKN